MKKPEKGWMTPNAWLMWKLEGWTLGEIKVAFLALIPNIPGGLIASLWQNAMRIDGYYSRLDVPDDAGEPDQDKEVS